MEFFKRIEANEIAMILAIEEKLEYKLLNSAAHYWYELKKWKILISFIIPELISLFSKLYIFQKKKLNN